MKLSKIKFSQTIGTFVISLFATLPMLILLPPPNAFGYHVTNKTEVRRGLSENDGGNWIVIYSKEFSHQEYLKLAAAILTDALTAELDAGAVTTAYFYDFALESLNKVLQESAEKAPSLADQIKKELTLNKVLRAVKASFKGGTVELSIGGVKFQVGNVSYNRAECTKVFGKKQCIPTPNTHQPYIRFKVLQSQVSPSPATEQNTSQNLEAQQKIIGFYRDFLSREPRSDEIDFRMDAFRKGYPLEKQRTDIAFSDEVRQRIIGFYRQYLGRDPESGAVEFRMNALLNGHTLEQQRTDIESSDEARQKIK
jgi:hypothetical protein